MASFLVEKCESINAIQLERKRANIAEDDLMSLKEL
jgi:hypothetical protein